MTKEEFDLKVKEVSESIRCLISDRGVWAHTSLYGFLCSASMAMDMAALRVEQDLDDSLEDKLSHD